MHKLRVCPFCGANVQYAGITSGHIFPEIHTGQMYICKGCGYKGSFILEVDDSKEAKKIKEEYKKLKKQGKSEINSFRFHDNWIWFWRIVLFGFIYYLILNLISVFS